MAAAVTVGAAGKDGLPGYQADCGTVCKASQAAAKDKCNEKNIGCNAETDVKHIVNLLFIPIDQPAVDEPWSGPNELSFPPLYPISLSSV